MKKLLIFTILLFSCQYSFGGSYSCEITLQSGFSSKIKLEKFRCMGCYFNSYFLLEALITRPDFNIEEASVLYLSSFAGWGAHAVVLYRGLILDANSTMEGRREVGSTVLPRTIESYFADESWYNESDILLIPALDYLRDFSPNRGDLGPIPYLNLLEGAPQFGGDSQSIETYWLLGVEEWLRSLGIEQGPTR